jgi:hypothetical protein
LAFNTGASFVTNINWQSHSGETSLSNFSQMAVIIFPQVASAATGLAAADGFMHGPAGGLPAILYAVGGICTLHLAATVLGMIDGARATRPPLARP